MFEHGKRKREIAQFVWRVFMLLGFAGIFMKIYFGIRVLTAITQVAAQPALLTCAT